MASEEATTYEGTIALLDRIKEAAEELAASVENAGATLAAHGLTDGAITRLGQIVEGATVASEAAIQVRDEFVTEQGPIWERRQAGLLATGDFYGR